MILKMSESREVKQDGQGQSELVLKEISVGLSSKNQGQICTSSSVSVKET